MDEPVAINLIAICCITALAWLFGGDDAEDRFFWSWGAFWFSTIVSMIGWAVFVAHHFIVKYW